MPDSSLTASHWLPSHTSNSNNWRLNLPAEDKIRDRIPNAQKKDAYCVTAPFLHLRIFLPFVLCSHQFSSQFRDILSLFRPSLYYAICSFCFGIWLHQVIPDAARETIPVPPFERDKIKRPCVMLVLCLAAWIKHLLKRQPNPQTAPPGVSVSSRRNLPPL